MKFNIYGSNDTSGSYTDEITTTDTIMYRTDTVATSASDMIYCGANASVTVPQPIMCANIRVKFLNNTTSAGHASAVTIYWCLKNT